MKKVILVYILAATILITTGVWYFNSANKLDLADLTGPGVIILLVGFALFVGLRKLGSAKRGEPTEDELSKKVIQKTASLSYYISLYLWLFLAHFSDKTKLATDTVFAIGILGMALIFALCWVFFNFRGIKNE